ncbi:MAG: substrate-binding domain-containing protein [Endomicrobiales bacterium]|nr:substrate-binding domain-containing protein [Endomicrobiales bacterium]
MSFKNSIVLLNRSEKHFTESFYYRRVKLGIDTAIDGSGYNLVQAMQDSSLPDNVSEKCGVVSIAPHVNHQSVELLRKSKMPSILINCRSEDMSWVDVDNVRGAITMTEYLVGLGHRNILLVNGFPESQNSIDRQKGFVETLQRHSIEFNPRMVISCDFSVSLAYERMKNFLSQNKKRDFTAIFSTNDYMAVGIIRALTDENIKVPEDVAVVGFDDLDFASNFYIPLTTYRQPFPNIGFVATKLLMKQIENGRSGPHQVELMGELIIRDSCGAKLRVGQER